MAFKNDQVSEEETAVIIECAKKCLEVPGDFVEMGCYKGDTSLLLAELLSRDGRLRQEVRYSSNVYEKEPQVLSVENSVEDSVEKYVDKYVENSAENHVKKLWIYDSFEGLPEKNEQDESVLGEDFKKGELFVTKREVKERFLRAGLRVPVIKKGWFNELTAQDMPEKIAFAFLDGDFYESIRDSLRLVCPKMARGGIILVHDYVNPSLPGVKIAVDEWIKYCGFVEKKSLHFYCANALFVLELL